MPDNLPPPIELYFETDRIEAIDRLSDCFTEDAVVTDEKRTHRGLDAIFAWKRDVMAAVTYTVTPLKLERDGARTVVTGRLEGDFPGSPVVLRYFFTLAGDRIASLEIRP